MFVSKSTGSLGSGLFESVYEEILAYELDKMGLLINFNEALLKDGIQRLVNGL